MLEFILNDTVVRTGKPGGSLLLDFIRYEQQHFGTKIGCREGDCGACTVLIGTPAGKRIRYHSASSCLTPIANVAGKHVVTIEGLNMAHLSPAQEAIIEEGATQCGFCTPGFVVSLTGFCLEPKPASYPDALAAIDGNICRCTGYKSLERAARRLTEALAGKDSSEPVDWLVANGFLPDYFRQIPEKLQSLQPPAGLAGTQVGGGTDLYVQKPEALVEKEIAPLDRLPGLKGIRIDAGSCTIGAGVTVAELLASAELQAIFPRLGAQVKLVSSTPIRQMATLGGNFVNASPIGDMTIFFIALNAQIRIEQNGAARTILLKDLYRGYKTLDLQPGEIVTALRFDLPAANSRFNFEKVSKRTHLDIASVNSAMLVTVENQQIADIHLSAGGIGPVPAYLANTCAFLRGRPLNPETLEAATPVLQGEISPISDIRGSAAYKRLLLRQLFRAHFLTLFPDILKPDMLP